MKKDNRNNTAKSQCGRPRKYTPATLAAKFDEYKNSVKSSPIYVNKVSAGEIVKVPTERPLTIVGFCAFANITRETFRQYEGQEAYSDVLARVRTVIEADQLEGALVDVYNPSIVARVLHLADRQDVTTNGKDMPGNGPTVIRCVYEGEEFEITAADVD